MTNIIRINLPHGLNIDEFKKCIPFVSLDIQSYKILGDSLELKLNEDSDVPLVQRNTENAIKKFVSRPEVNYTLYKTENENKRDYCDEVIDNKNIVALSDGSISLHEKAAILFDFFDQNLEDMALQIGAKIEHYSTMLPVEEYRKTGYLKTSPQYSIFCCNAIEDFSQLEKLHASNSCELKSLISEPRDSLSPAACFHTYCSHKNETFEESTIYTFNQAVFRNEGRFNWQDFGRLKDYHVREVVFLGNENFVNENRKKLLDIVIEFLKKVGLNFCVTTANDPFVMPKMQKFKKIQLQEGSKYELLLKYSSKKSIAVASFNIHGTAFTQPFNIKIKNIETPVTGCAGFGIERWVLAFIAQYGWDDNQWPLIIKEYIK